MRDGRTEPDGRRRGWIALAVLAGIVALAVALRAAWIAHIEVDPLDGRFDDSVFYYATATSLARDLAYRNPYTWGAFTAQWPPGYPLVLGGVFAVFGTHLIAAKALNVALAAATVALTYAVGARVFGRRTGIVAALLFALAPGHIFFSPLVMTEVLFCFGFLAVIAMLIWWTIDVARVSWRWWFLDAGDPALKTPHLSKFQEPRMLALGIATGCLTLVRSEAVFLPFIFIAFWLVVLPRWRPLLWHTAIFGAGFVFALTPWAARNYARFDRVIVLRTGESNVLSLAFDSHYNERSNPFYAGPLPPAETAGYWARHPWKLVPLEFTKLKQLYRDDSDGIAWTRQHLSARDAARFSHIADRYFFAVGACAIAAAPLLWRGGDRRRWALVYVLAAWTAVLIVNWPQTRYHLPLVPIICLFAAWAVVSAWSGAVAAVRWLGARAATREAPARDEAPGGEPPATGEGEATSGIVDAPV